MSYGMKMRRPLSFKTQKKWGSDLEKLNRNLRFPKKLYPYRCNLGPSWSQRSRTGTADDRWSQFDFTLLPGRSCNKNLSETFRSFSVDENGGRSPDQQPLATKTRDLIHELPIKRVKLSHLYSIILFNISYYEWYFDLKPTGKIESRSNYSKRHGPSFLQDPGIFRAGRNDTGPR